MKKEKMITVTFELPESKIAEILGASYGKVELSALQAGEIFSTGKHEWVVLEQGLDATLVLHRDCLEDYRRFDASSNNWITSELRRWLNEEFAREVEQEIGKDNLVAHISDLSTDDGSDNYASDGKRDRASLISCGEYRQYRKFIPKTDGWYWTLTPLSSEAWKNAVRCVYGNRALNHNYCNYDNGGVRPSCIFKSNILVSRKI